MSKLGGLRVLAGVAVLALAGAHQAGAQSCAGNPAALGLARTVEIDTTGGPGFGFEQYKQHDFLEAKEVVLTFDDGPWPTTRAVLDALDQNCTKATFFIIGKHALYYPEILKEVAQRGHTIGTHTWSHANLGKLSDEKAKDEIEKGISAVRLALGAAPSAFFRFPYLQDPPSKLSYLGARNVGIFSHDVDSFDFKLRKAEDLVKSVMTRLEKKGKGILLMHDFQAATSKGLPLLLAELKAKGYKVVHMKAKSTVSSIAEYDAVVKAEQKTPAMGVDKPTSSIVRTVP